MKRPSCAWSPMVLLACGLGFAGCSHGSAPVGPANVSEVSSVNDFDQRVAKAKTPVVVDCFATWCGPCTQLAPELDAVAASHLTTLTVLRVDVDKVPELAARYHAEAIPLLVLIKKGQVVSQQVGYQDRGQITTWIGQ